MLDASQSEQDIEQPLQVPLVVTANPFRQAVHEVLLVQFKQFLEQFWQLAVVELK